MAHFYVSTENSRGNAVTASGRKSGQRTHARGWSSGLDVSADIDENGRDRFTVYATKGSTNSGHAFMVGVLIDDPERGPVWHPSNLEAFAFDNAGNVQ